MADAQVLGTCGSHREGSSPSVPTIPARTRRFGNAGEMPRGEGMRASIGSLAEHLGVSYLDEEFGVTVEAALARQDPLLVEWLTVSAAKLEKVLVGVCALLDPEAVIFSGRMPEPIRAALASRIQLAGRAAGGIAAPAPSIVVDPATDCLETGAAALPIAGIFSEVSRAAMRS